MALDLLRAIDWGTFTENLLISLNVGTIKVNNLEPFVVSNHQIVQFKVKMSDTFFMEILNTAHKVSKEGPSELFVEFDSLGGYYFGKGTVRGELIANKGDLFRFFGEADCLFVGAEKHFYNVFVVEVGNS